MYVFLAWRLISTKKIVSAEVYAMAEANFKVLVAPQGIDLPGFVVF